MSAVSQPVSLNDFADGPVVKRRKKAVTLNTDKFAPGAIIKLKVKNFVVYSSAEFILSPSLNMIIAPNGTGKSTFVCAACLGLAGAPSLLGRQKTLAGFIKNGEESARIEITLKNKPNKRDLVVTRDIYQNNKSDWLINNKTAKEPEVKRQLHELNVQLDNLCQFLPQEKVASFAALDQKDLLVETQRAVDVKLMEQHSSLIEMDKTKIELSTRLASLQQEKVSLEADKEHHAEAAKKYEAHQKKQREIEDHNALIPFARIEDLKVEREALKIARDRLQEQLDAYDVDMAPIEEAKSSVEELLNNASNDLHDKHKLLTDTQSKLDVAAGQLEKCEEKIDSLNVKITLIEQNSKKKQKELDDKIALVKEAEEVDKNTEPVDEAELKEAERNAAELYEQVAEYDERVKELQQGIETATRAINRATGDAKRARTELGSKDRFQHLFTESLVRKNKSASEAKNAIRLLRTEFKDMRNEVFEPPCLSISATNSKYIEYLEQLVPVQTTMALTAISKQAYDKHSPKFFEEKHVKVSFRYLSNKKLQGQLSQTELKELGFDGYLKDFLQGPPAVIQMLSEVAFIHDTPVALNPPSERQLEILGKSHNGRLLCKKFFSGNLLYTVSQSIYGSRQVLVRTTSVRPPMYYSNGGVSESTKRHFQEQIRVCENMIRKNEETIEGLKTQIEDVKDQSSELNKEFEEYKNLEKDLKRKKTNKDKAITRVVRLKKQLAELERESNRDFGPEIDKNRERIKKLGISKIKLLCTIADLQAEVNTVSRAHTLLDIKRFEAENKKRSLNNLFKFIIDQRRKLEADLKTAKLKLQEAKNSPEVKQLKAKVSKYDDETNVRLAGLVEHYRDLEVFTEMGILDLSKALNAELSLLGTTSKSSVNALGRLNARLDVLSNEMPELERQLKTISKQMSEISEVWEPRLNAMVDKISAKFSSIFPTVGSAGEVRVARAPRYADWKMEIMVKFRDAADLKALDSHTQSGGERAVSTVYYMISMQELTSSPFRVVDEINQGMDARNERIVHKHMVEVACQEHTSQYFLITPKLLTDLHYASNMRVHCIMAGPWVPDASKHPDFLGLGATTLYDNV